MKMLWPMAIALSLLFGLGAYLAADNQPPYDYIASQSYVRPNPARGGRQVTVHWEFKVNRTCPGVIIRTIVDAKTKASVSYDPTPAANTVRIGDTSLERTFFLPEAMLPGPKLYRVNAQYACNPLQYFWPLKVQTPDIPFEVAPNERIE